LWADRFDKNTGDLIALQDEITRRIAVALNLELNHRSSPIACVNHRYWPRPPTSAEPMRAYPPNDPAGGAMEPLGR
jgi:hypothetical protein